MQLHLLCQVSVASTNPSPTRLGRANSEAPVQPAKVSHRRMTCQDDGGCETFWAESAQHGVSLDIFGGLWCFGGVPASSLWGWPPPVFRWLALFVYTISNMIYAPVRLETHPHRQLETVQSPIWKLLIIQYTIFDMSNYDVCLSLSQMTEQLLSHS